MPAVFRDAGKRAEDKTDRRGVSLWGAYSSAFSLGTTSPGATKSLGTFPSWNFHSLPLVLACLSFPLCFGLLGETDSSSREGLWLQPLCDVSAIQCRGRSCDGSVIHWLATVCPSPHTRDCGHHVIMTKSLNIQQGSIYTAQWQRQ